jgi:trans-aconitate methyltransferase
VNEAARAEHWQKVYTTKNEGDVSWFQEEPVISLELINGVRPNLDSAIVDVGGGASRLVDNLLARGNRSIAVLDVSDAALISAKARLGEAGEKVQWITADVTRWQPDRIYDIWHDRAAFHFLTEAEDREAYVARLLAALRPGGHAIIGTFAIDGPEKCSGLTVRRYDAAGLNAELGSRFALVEARRHEHITPWQSVQHFQFGVFQRRS